MAWLRVLVLARGGLGGMRVLRQASPRGARGQGARGQGARMGAVRGQEPERGEREKGIRWMPWRQEAMKDVARCDKPWGAASRL